MKNGDKVRRFRMYSDGGNPVTLERGYQNIFEFPNEDRVEDIYLEVVEMAQGKEYFVVEVIGNRKRMHRMSALDYVEFES